MVFPDPLSDRLAAIVRCSPCIVQARCGSGGWPYTKAAGKLLFKEQHVRYIVGLGENWPTVKLTELESPGAATSGSRRRTRIAEPGLAPRGGVRAPKSKVAPPLAGGLA
jgi:hypothetical protein